MSILEGEKQFHLKIKSGDVGGYVLLPGDPGRVAAIAAHLEDAHMVAQNREYTTYTGYLCGEKVSVTSTGIGGPSTAIAVEELIKCGGHTFIRVGTSGGIREDVLGGDLIVVTGAVRGDGTSYEYIPPDYPAVSDFAVTKALEQSGTALLEGTQNQCHVGVVQSKDSFYGETNPETMPVSRYLEERWEAYVRCGCLTSEMECAALFAVGAARAVRTGGVLLALWNAERERKGMENPNFTDTSRVIECAVGAVKILIQADRTK